MQKYFNMVKGRIFLLGDGIVLFYLRVGMKFVNSGIDQAEKGVKSAFDP